MRERIESERRARLDAAKLSQYYLENDLRGFENRCTGRGCQRQGEHAHLQAPGGQCSGRSTWLTCVWACSLLRAVKTRARGGRGRGNKTSMGCWAGVMALSKEHERCQWVRASESYTLDSLRPSAADPQPRRPSVRDR